MRYLLFYQSKINIPLTLHNKCFKAGLPKIISLWGKPTAKKEEDLALKLNL